MKMGGGSLAPVEQHEEQPSTGEVGDEVDVNTPDADAPGDSDPEEDVPSDIVVSEGDASGEAEEPGDTETVPGADTEEPGETETVPGADTEEPGETETVPGETEEPGETETVPGETEEPGDAEAVPGAGEQPEGDPDPSADNETDPGLEEMDGEAVSLQADDGIMLVSSAVCPESDDGEHHFVTVEDDDDESRTKIALISVDDTYHTYKYRIHTYERCEYCGAINNEEGKFSYRDVEIKSEHEWDKGICYVCNYECKHTGGTIEDWSPLPKDNPLWEIYGSYDWNSEEHWPLYLQYKAGKCPLCGLDSDADNFMFQVVEGEHEPHKSGENGECTVCGIYCEEEQGETHTHVWVESDTYVTYDSYHPNEAGKCVGVGRHVVQEYYCDVNGCEEYRTADVSYDPGKETVVDHDFSYDGKCYNCGYMKINCKHDNLMLWSIGYADDVFAGADVKSNQDGTHTGVMRVEVGYRCPDCGYIYWDYEKREITEQCSRYMDEDGEDDRGTYRKCVLCGYKEYLPVVEYEEHEHVWVLYGRYESPALGENQSKPTLDPDDSSMHVFERTAVAIWEVCAICGSEEYRTEYVDEPCYAPHTFIDDTCACGAKRTTTCAHKNTETSEWYGDFTREPRVGYSEYENDNTHVNTYYASRYVYCVDCGATVDVEYAVRSDVEPHDYNINGICESCGWQRQANRDCTHPSTHQVQIFNDYSYSGDYYKECLSVNSREHVVYGIYTEYTVCDICQRRVPETPVTRGYYNDDEGHQHTEPHTFERMEYSDGSCFEWCTTCGYSHHVDPTACDHPDLKTPGYELDDKVSYEEITEDDAQHTVYTSKGWECPDCGEKLYPGEDVTSDTEAHSYKDGVCTKCGHKCAHTNKQNDAEQPEPVTEYIPKDDYTHTEVVTTTMAWTCPDCGEKGTTTADPVETPNQPHHYDADGNCTECGHTCTHDGGNAKVMGDERSTYTHDDATHTPATVTPWTCDICKASGEDPATTGDPEAHTYDKNAEGEYECSVCGHVCEHSNATETPTPTGEEKFDIKEDTHQKLVEMHVTVKCPNCKSVVEEKDEFRPEGAAEAHKWDAEKGECSVCGYQCEHQYGKPVETVEWGKYVADDDVTHTRMGTKIETETCTVCGHQNVTQTSVKDKQLHTYVDGVCSDPDCKHVCEHKGADLTAKDPVTEITERQETLGDDTNHKTLGTTTTEYTCEYCGETVKTEVEDYEGTEKHTYEDGVCTVCGHPCGHSNKTTAAEFVPDGTYTSNGAKGHTASGRVDEVTTCDDCDKELERVQGAEPATQEQPHSFENGKCTLCGYVKPAPAEDETDEQEKADDEPVFEPVEKGTAMHGLSVGDGSRMATALCKAVDGIQAEYGADVRIYVHDADKILTADEYRTLGALPVREQILVVLTALGYVDEMQAGLSELDIELSQAARDLIAEIAQRLEGMTEAERAEYLALLAEYFPATVDGDAQHTEIVLEMHVKLDEGYRMERYGFDLRDGKWYYARLDVAGAND